MIQTIKILITALGIAILGGCTSTKGERSETPASAESTAAQGAGERGPAGGMMSGMCPMQVPGTTVTSEDVEGGVALVFTTTSKGDVAELRQRVQRMAEMHNQHHAAGGMMMGCCGAAAPHEQGPGAGPGHEAGGPGSTMMGGGMMGGGMMMPAATASVEDIEGGARLVLRPKDPAQLGALRQHVRARAERMQHGECPMMAPE